MNKSRPKKVLIRLSEEEYTTLKQMVADSQMTQQAFLINKIFSVLAPRHCPLCGSELVLKEGRRGKFWGCSNFPDCRYSEDWKGN